MDLWYQEGRIRRDLRICDNFCTIPGGRRGSTTTISDIEIFKTREKFWKESWNYGLLNQFDLVNTFQQIRKTQQGLKGSKEATFEVMVYVVS